MAPLPVKEGRCRQVAAEGSVLTCSQGPGSVCRWELSPLAPRPSFQVNIWRNVLSGVRGTRERVFFPKRQVFPACGRHTQGTCTQTRARTHTQPLLCSGARTSRPTLTMASASLVRWPRRHAGSGLSQVRSLSTENRGPGRLRLQKGRSGARYCDCPSPLLSVMVALVAWAPRGTCRTGHLWILV